MPTGTLRSSARDYHTRQRSFLSQQLTNANFPAAATIKMGTIPAGSVIVAASFATSIVFNNATLNQLSLGNAASGAQIAASTVGLAALGSTPVTVVAAAAGPLAADTDIYVTNTSTGGGQSTGAAVAFVE